MSVSFDFSGIEPFRARTREAAAIGLTRAAQVLQAQQRLIMQRTPPSGEKDPRYLRSAPGTPPAVQTGRLRNSVTHQAASAANLVARAGTNVAYGRYLEFGSSKMAPRPWAQRSVDVARPKMMAEFKRGCMSALKTGGKP